MKNMMGRCLLGGVLISASLMAGAATVEITAEFKPDPTNPMVNKFTNTSPPDGYCAGEPAACKAANIFSLNIPSGFPQTRGGPIKANHPDQRQGAYFQVPSDWRSITVVPDDAGGNPETLEIRIAGIGGRHDLGASVHDITGGDVYGHWNLWSSGHWGLTAPAPCRSAGTKVSGGAHFINYMWLVPEGAGVCAPQAKFDIPDFHLRFIQFAYELRTPNPLKMRTGRYTGQITYSMGPRGDFDFGDHVRPNDNSLTLNFVLDVMHELKVEVPPGGNRIELLPQGGWQAWLNKGRKPERLFRDQTFNISASSRFKMSMECQFKAFDINSCAVADSEGQIIAGLNVSVSLPRGLSDASGRPVERRPLLLDGSGTELFQPTFYVERKPGTLHFEIPANEVAEMISPGRPGQYSGNVTVIWDSEV
ncbi:hypothetical protein KJF94_21010 [Pseudomonas hormoni]|uniref:Fimbrial protein n=2 Tax=Pseudomonas hormoni TaxID=3093767 RepID=A0ABX8F739_9PSED|nr:hypothetical protein KJF94_21010 [Pseudomonas hormoni]